MDSSDKTERTEKTLHQLLKYIEQLTRSEQDPGVDLGALARSCDRQLNALKKLMPPGAGLKDGTFRGEDARRIAGILHEVDRRTQICIRILRTAKARVEMQRGSLRRSKRVIKAYRMPVHPPRSRFSGATA